MFLNIECDLVPLEVSSIHHPMGAKVVAMVTAWLFTRVICY